MNEPINRQTRHFPYQHPTFGTKNRPTSERSWKRSVYYWWWEYLKRSKDYLECCENGGRGKCAKIYNDFGDVRDKTFKRWWLDGNRGADLFADLPVEETVRVLKKGEKALSDDEYLTISFPKKFPIKMLEKRFKELLKLNRKRGRGRTLARDSNAKYRFNGQPNIEGLRTALRVYDFAQENPQLKLWEIGNQLPRFLAAYKTNPNDPNFSWNKNILGATVKRHLTNVERRLKSVALGQFP